MIYIIERKYKFGACHYCICTACSRFNCPWSYKLERECYNCRERGENVPRLDCSFFAHHMKTHHFKFKRASLPLPEYFGTYILQCSKGVFIGSHEKLVYLQNRFGGKLQRLNIIDHFLEIRKE